MREKNSLTEILGDFKPASSSKTGPRRPVTFWLAPEDQVRFARLQEMSRREFGRKAREALIALMDLAEAKTA